MGFCLSPTVIEYLCVELLILEFRANLKFKRFVLHFRSKKTITRSSLDLVQAEVPADAHFDTLSLRLFISGCATGFYAWWTSLIHERGYLARFSN